MECGFTVSEEAALLQNAVTASPGGTRRIYKGSDFPGNFLYKFLWIRGGEGGDGWVDGGFVVYSS